MLNAGVGVSVRVREYPDRSAQVPLENHPGAQGVVNDLRGRQGRERSVAVRERAHLDSFGLQAA